MEQRWFALPSDDTVTFIGNRRVSSWEIGEMEADEDIRLGRVTHYESGEDFLQSL